MNVVAVVQARLGSTRFPKKVLQEISPGLSIIQLLVSRLRLSQNVNRIIVAIPNSKEDDSLALHLQKTDIEIYRGSKLDVQSRYIEVSQKYSADWLVRVTGDCPLVDPWLVDQLVQLATNGDFDYFSNISPPTMPDGLDIEVFRSRALVKSRALDGSDSSREHVTPHLRESGVFRTGSHIHKPDLSQFRWTVDYPEDLLQIRATLPLGFETMGWLALIGSGFKGVVNSNATRNEGSVMGEGQKLWSRAKSVIPGGSMLLSKRPEMYLPDKWPTYYSKSKGIEVTDLDGRTYLDFSTMSVGACSLGYGNPVVDEAVINAVREGVMSTLNSPAEVQLAEKLVQLHPWAGMARFARSGGEANAIAVRIARAHTKKDKIAICGYHGWHDWYLSANLGESSNLDGHLLPGLDPAGVPRALKGTAVPFQYNDADSLEKLLRTGEFAAVLMEVSRNFGPAEGFLERVRELCSLYGAVLIFDECTSGFRETLGGLHLKYGVAPDMAMFGKALGNGFAITAVIGTHEVMQSAQSTFISSTFWTERIGPVAAMATLAEMERQRSWEVVTSIGQKMKQIWKAEFENSAIPVAISGLDALPTFTIQAPHWLVLKTLLSQEMLNKGFLAGSAFYASTAHEVGHLDGYRQALQESLRTLSDNFDRKDAERILQGPVAHSGFARLN